MNVITSLLVVEADEIGLKLSVIMDVHIRSGLEIVKAGKPDSDLKHIANDFDKYAIIIMQLATC